MRELELKGTVKRLADKSYEAEAPVAPRPLLKFQNSILRQISRGH